jgi:hypothetical protein
MEDLKREIEDLQCEIQQKQVILNFLQERLGDIQPEPPDIPPLIPVTKRELIKKTGEKLRRPFDMHDLQDYVLQNYSNCPFYPPSLNKIFREMVNRGELIKVRQGRPGPVSEKTNLYELASPSASLVPTTAK